MFPFWILPKNSWLEYMAQTAKYNKHQSQKKEYTLFPLELILTWRKKLCNEIAKYMWSKHCESCKSLDLSDSHLTVPISVFSEARKVVVTRTKNNTRALCSSLTAHLFSNCFFSLVWFSLLIVRALYRLDIYCSSIDLSAHTPALTINSEEGCFVSWK